MVIKMNSIQPLPVLIVNSVPNFLGVRFKIGDEIENIFSIFFWSLCKPKISFWVLVELVSTTGVGMKKNDELVKKIIALKEQISRRNEKTQLKERRPSELSNLVHNLYRQIVPRRELHESLHNNIETEQDSRITARWVSLDTKGMKK